MSRKPWIVPDREITDESVYLNRRRFMKAVGLGGLAAGGFAALGRGVFERALAEEPLPALEATRNPAFADAGRPLTDADLALKYNNFYEFTTVKEDVWKVAKDFALDPYGLEVKGLVDTPGTLTLEQVEALGLEERVYRFRCVEAWAMTVPWIGVPLKAVLEKVGVKPEANYVWFHSFLDKKQAPGQRSDTYTWPYYEALRLDEAMHPLTLVVTGVYGRRLPPQSGAPLRIIVPWKYGYKSPKSVVSMQLMPEQPPTFWNDEVPAEYSWLSNVDPKVPHPRWSQASERVLGLDEERATLPFNGYGDQVAKLYAPK